MGYVTSAVMLPSEVAECKRRALSGDMLAARKLSYYFSLQVFDEDEAIRWLTLVAESGDSNAQYSLGVTYSSSGKHHDDRLARYWFGRAVAAGDFAASRELDRLKKSK